jgi:hypothetical protein
MAAIEIPRSYKSSISPNSTDDLYPILAKLLGTQFLISIADLYHGSHPRKLRQRRAVNTKDK